MMKKIIIAVFSILILLSGIFAFNISSLNAISDAAKSDKLDLTSQSAVLMEPTTGTIIYEKNPHERLRPASVTKIMTLLLIYDAAAAGKIKWDDVVTVSENASGMGGSQVYLEQNEQQTVATLTKCIAVASANDGAVAMAEFIGGSEAEFVNMMNERAKSLNMVDTHFENASGLDTDNHYTSAYDIALMARELTTKYPEIFDLTTIWMDTIVHNTRRGSEEFGLTNTNKLLQWYDGATGLKTGSTSLAKYCLAGTATRNNLDLIAVVMAAPDYKVRFQEVMKMFDFGFSVCKKYSDQVGGQAIGKVAIKKGVIDEADVIAKEDYNYLLINMDASKIDKKIEIPETVDAPIAVNQKVGEIIYTYDGNEIGRVDLIIKEPVIKASLGFYIQNIFMKFFK